MNANTAHILREYGPLIGFLITYWFAPDGEGIWRPMILATGVFTLLTIITLGWTFLLGLKPSSMNLLIAALVIPMGIATVLLNDDAIFKMKPTVVNLVLALLVGVSQYQQRPIIKNLLGNSIELTEKGWAIMSWRWAIFFCASAVANEIAWRNMSDDGWVTFKFAVLVPAAFIFALLQLGVIKKHALQNTNTN